MFKFCRLIFANWTTGRDLSQICRDLFQLWQPGNVWLSRGLHWGKRRCRDGKTGDGALNCNRPLGLEILHCDECRRWQTQKIMKTQTNKRKKQDTVLYTGHWVPSEKSFHHRDLRAIRVWGHFTLLEKYNTTSCKPHADTYHSFFVNKQTSWPGVKMLVQCDKYFCKWSGWMDW